MRKIFLLMLAVLMVMLSGCVGSDPDSSETLSGKYVSVDDSTRYLVFGDTRVTLYESDKQVRSGEYRFQNGALIITYTEFSERYTFDESRETLYEGNSNKANFGETVFVKGTGGSTTPGSTKAVNETTANPLTAEEAKAQLQSWLNDHPFQLDSNIEDTYDDSFVFEDAEYYTFYLRIAELGIFDVFVNKETGEMFSSSDGEEFSLLSLDIWYGQYGGYANGNGDDVPYGYEDDEWQPIVYNDMFELVTEPCFEKDNKGNIVGELKNVTNKTYDVVIKFSLYDSSGNQIGTVLDSITNLKSDNTWRYSAINWDDTAISFEIAEISYR